jgi:hypothetical protein
VSYNLKKIHIAVIAGQQRLMLVILANQEAEIWRTAV